MTTSDTSPQNVRQAEPGTPRPQPDRRRKILDATLDQVATHGLLNTTMSKISSAAQASAGILYHYFDNKEDLMDALFVDAFQDMTNAVTADIDLDQPPLERITTLWLRKYEYHYNHPAETGFMEQYKNSSLFTAQAIETMNTINTPLIAMVEQDQANSALAELPLVTINTMTLGVALMLAKDHRTYDITLDAPTLSSIANRCARSVLA